MTTQRYAAHGLVIDSAYPLPMLLSTGPGEPDIIVRRGSARPVPEEDAPGSEQLALAEAPDGRVFYSFTADPGGVTLRYPGLCLMRADAEVQRVDVHAETEANEGLIPVLVAGAVVSLHLILRGRLALHASAVEISGQTLALVGMSGMGKSTTATLLALAGHPLVTDDVLHVEFTTGQDVAAHRGGLESRLRQSASELADGSSARRTSDGRWAVDLPMTDKPLLPLAACVVPQPSRTVGRVTLRRLGPAAAMTTLLRFPRLSGWTEPRRLAEQFSLVGDLAARVPVLLAELPWGPPFAPSLADELVASLDALRVLKNHHHHSD